MRITPFDGNPKNRNLWFGLFKTLIDNKPLHDAEKMSHLQTLTVGRANEAIRGFSCNSSPDQRKYPLDNQNHYLGHCETFRKMSAGNRKKKCLELKRCFHCLGAHTVKECKSQSRCKFCNGTHHTLLHDPSSSNEE